MRGKEEQGLRVFQFPKYSARNAYSSRGVMPVKLSYAQGLCMTYFSINFMPGNRKVVSSFSRSSSKVP